MNLRPSSRAKPQPVDVLMVSSAHLFGDPRITMKEAPALAGEFSVALVQPAADPDEPGVVGDAAAGVVALFEQVPVSARLHRIRRMVRAFRTSLAYRPRVVHLQNPELLVFLPLWRLFGIREFVFDAHENPAALLLETCRGRVRHLRRPLRAVIHVLARRTHVVIAETSYRRHFAHARSITQVLNYPRGELISPPRGEMSPADGPKLVYLGLLEPERGLWDMLDACAELRRRGVAAELDLIGPAGPGVADQLRRAVDAAEGVQWDGPMPPPEAWRRLSDYDIGLAVLHATENYSESFPTKIPEYLLAGLLVVTTDLPLYRFSVDDCDARFVAPRSPHDLADAVEALMVSGDLSSRGRAERRRRAEDRFTWDSQARQLVALYRRLLPKRAAVDVPDQRPLVS
jgi:glycosyltransferase involved in cell wall biosynthesis